MDSKRIAAFDVIGTLFPFEALGPLIEQEWGEALKAAGVSNGAYVALLWYGWGQRDFSFLSQNNQYTPIAQIFASTLPRAIKMACVDLPEDRQPRFTEEAIKRVTSQLSKLPPRDDIVETMDKLQKAGFEIWPVSNGAKASTLAMFNNAQQLKADDRGDDHFVKDLEHHIISCDTISVAKPDPRVYAHLKSEAKVGNASSSWFIAAHAWDLQAARQAGFKTAYLNDEERDSCSSIFGKPDIEASSLSALANQIIAATNETKAAPSLDHSRMY